MAWVQNAPDTYYFSVAARGTFYDELSKLSFASRVTHPILRPLANFAGAFKNDTLLEGDSIEWRPNDGAVPVISARGDFGGYTRYPIDLGVPMKFDVLSPFSKGYNVPSPQKRVFNFLGIMESDHFKVTGLLDLVGGKMNSYYKNVAGMLSSLPPRVN